MDAVTPQFGEMGPEYRPMLPLQPLRDTGANLIFATTGSCSWWTVLWDSLAFRR